MNVNAASACPLMNRRQFIRSTLAAAFAAAAAGCTIKTSTSNDAVKGIYILYTSDIHCGVDQHFCLAGLEQVRQSLEAQGYATILVDDGDAIQGEPMGTLTKGESVIQLMNACRYDVAIPGNHEFDYGMDRFFELVEMADFPYISCNFNKEGELVFDPYTIIEVAGVRIAFVGITTPETLTSSKPVTFQDDDGNLVYGFMQDETGEALCAAVQKAIDAARAEDVDLVYVMAHLGLLAESEPWTYADVIEGTTGIDVFFDGHSHDTEQVVMKDKAGRDVPRSACGTKLECVGYSFINAEGQIEDTGIWSWPNETSASTLFGLGNDVADAVEAEKAEIADIIDEVVATSAVDLTINDPVAKDSSGNPVRIVRSAETNMGDFVADAIRDQSGSDIGVINSGAIRESIKKGDVTYGDIIAVHPFGNELCMLEVTGQQILDALEWGVRELPNESAALLQVSGLTYAVDESVPSGCKQDSEGMCAGISGERRVHDVRVGNEELDPDAKYTLASMDYVLLMGGDGINFFMDDEVLEKGIKLDNQVLMDYIIDTLGGQIGAEYAEPYGQGRITFVE